VVGFLFVDAVMGQRASNQRLMGKQGQGSKSVTIQQH
jgi:hypothetical protein